MKKNIIKISLVGMLLPLLAATFSNLLVSTNAFKSRKENYVQTKKNDRFVEPQLSMFAENITLEEVNTRTPLYEVYGNTDVTFYEFNNIVRNSSAKIFILYRTDRAINLPFDALLKIKINDSIKSYEFTEELSSEPGKILNGIISFVNKYVNDGFLKKQSMLEPSRVSVANNSVPTTFINCVVEKEFVMRFDDKGYIVYHIAVSRYIANEKSIIFIVSSNNSFVPGLVALKNNETGYNPYCNVEGFVHMTVEQAYDSNEEYYYGKRWGNIPYKKDYWPVNEPGVAAITSSIEHGVTFGYSFENGFSLDNLSVTENRNIGKNISFGYSKTITRTEPAMSVQVNSSNTDKCERYYKYARETMETNHINSNYMFEIANTRNGMFRGDFRLKLDFMFGVDWNGLLRSETMNGSRDLIVRAGELNDIYDFDSGRV